MMNQSTFFGLMALVLLAGCGNPALRKGLKSYDEMAYADAIDQLNMALEKDSASAEAKIALADAYRLTNNYTHAERMYRQVVQLPDSRPGHKLEYARILMSANKHEEAANMIRLYLQDRPDDKVAKSLLEACNYIELFKADTAAYRLDEVPLFSNASMMSPVRYKNGIAYAAERLEGGKTNPWTGFTYYDIYYSHQINGDWQPQSKVGGNVSSKYHEGPITFNAAQDYAVITRSNYSTRKKLSTDEADVNNLGLYESRLVDGVWTDPVAMPFNNPAYSVGHGSLSADGKTLYFTSDMPGGMGGSDLYLSTFDGSNWSTPQNLGNVINTSGNEVFPTYHNDSTLYFSSDGQPSLGGLDIFKVEKTNDGWSTPSNMNFPLNSTADDFSILVVNDTTGYLTSNRRGNDRVFEYVKVPPVILIAGSALEKESGNPITGVTVKLINETDGTEQILATDATGKFEFNLLPNKKYRIEGSKDGYFKQSFDLSTADKSRSETIDLVFEMDHVVIGGDPPKFYTVDNIYYNYDEWEIRSDAARELDNLAKLLKDNDNLIIELHSHTDSRASKGYNQELSNKRAKAAVDYLISKGIPASRLGHKGFGENRLLNHCKDDVECTEEEHQLNRRTEFVIVSTTDEQ